MALRRALANCWTAVLNCAMFLVKGGTSSTEPFCSYSRAMSDSSFIVRTSRKLRHGGVAHGKSGGGSPPVVAAAVP
eukprot:9258240-Alexandrium_andersonii.AAC.1